jgi:beta-phosphoglucomutase
MPNQIRSFPNGCEIKHYPENSIVFEDSVVGVQAANIGNMTSIGIEKHLRCMKQYIFKDFTAIDTHFIEELIKE